jgi:hypothetical protein
MKDGRLIAILKQLRVIIERETTDAAKMCHAHFLTHFLGFFAKTTDPPVGGFVLVGTPA